MSSSLKLSVNRICLIFAGKMLLDQETLEMHDIADGSTVFLVAKPLQQVKTSFVDYCCNSNDNCSNNK